MAWTPECVWYVDDDIHCSKPQLLWWVLRIKEQGESRQVRSFWFKVDVMIGYITNTVGEMCCQ